MKPVQINGRMLALTVSKCGNQTSLVQTVDWMRWAAVPISATSSLCAFAVGGMRCSTLAGFVCTLCCAVGRLCVPHVVIISVKKGRENKVIELHILNQEKHDQAKLFLQSYSPYFISASNEYITAIRLPCMVYISS